MYNAPDIKREMQSHLSPTVCQWKISPQLLPGHIMAISMITHDIMVPRVLFNAGLKPWSRVRGVEFSAESSQKHLESSSTTMVVSTWEASRRVDDSSSLRCSRVMDNEQWAMSDGEPDEMAGDESHLNHVCTTRRRRSFSWRDLESNRVQEYRVLPSHILSREMIKASKTQSRNNSSLKVWFSCCQIIMQTVRVISLD